MPGLTRFINHMENTMDISGINVGDKLAIIGNGNHPAAGGRPYHLLKVGTEVEAVRLYPTGDALPDGFVTPVDVVEVQLPNGISSTSRCMT